MMCNSDINVCSKVPFDGSEAELVLHSRVGQLSHGTHTQAGDNRAIRRVLSAAAYVWHT